MPDQDAELESALRELEESLWRAETRFDHDYMDALLAPEFMEFGRSGRRYDRAATLSAGPGDIGARLPLENFRANAVSATVALVTYVSEVRDESVERANRSSLWIRSEAGWRLRFHQGTPAP